VSNTVEVSSRFAGLTAGIWSAIDLDHKLGVVASIHEIRCSAHIEG
jgi:hypothetical protein